MTKLWIALLIAVGLIGIVLVALGTWFLLDAKAMPDLFQAAGWMPEPSAIPTVTPIQLSPTRQATQVLPSITPSATSQRLTLTPTLTQTTTPTREGLVCPNTYPTRLKVGIRVFASLEPPLPNRIRQEPNTKSTIIGQIKPGEEADVMDGPACSEGWIWWKIKMAGGLIGWTAEGDGKDYWILPKK